MLVSLTHIRWLPGNKRFQVGARLQLGEGSHVQQDLFSFITCICDQKHLHISCLQYFIISPSGQPSSVGCVQFHHMFLRIEALSHFLPTGVKLIKSEPLTCHHCTPPSTLIYMLSSSCCTQQHLIPLKHTACSISALNQMSDDLTVAGVLKCHIPNSDDAFFLSTYIQGDKNFIGRCRIEAYKYVGSLSISLLKSINF